MKKALVIWEIIPEDTKFFIISKLNPNGVSDLIQCNGHFINNENEESVDEKLNNLSEELGQGISEKHPEVIEITKDELPTVLQNHQDLDLIVHTGFIC